MAETKEKGEFKVVGLEITSSVKECTENNPHPKLWEDFMKRAGEIKNRVGDIWYGVSEELSKDECTFASMACVEVSDLDNIPDGMTGKVVPASRYAVFEHKGKAQDLTATYGRIYEKDMPATGFKQKKIWLELYDERFKHDSDDSVMEIWISIE